MFSITSLRHDIVEYSKTNDAYNCYHLPAAAAERLCSDSKQQVIIKPATALCDSCAGAVLLHK